MKRTIKIIVTDAEGVLLDQATVQVDPTANMVVALALPSTITPNATRHWVADLDIGKGEENA